MNIETRVDDETLEAVVDEATADIKRGARRASAAIADGADAIEEALRPKFTESLADFLDTVRNDPGDFVDASRVLLREHPLATGITIAASALVLRRIWRSLAG